MKESPPQRKKRARRILALLKKEYPEAACTLDFGTPHQLLVATILSAQCTDQRVNQVTPRLFEKYPTPAAFAAAPLSRLEDDVRSTGFFRNKARAIKNSARKIVDDYDGRIPETMAELTGLPGVGRKTASVILGTAFGKAEGIVVDTHVGRLAKRLGLTDFTDAIRIEKDLMKIIPTTDWIILAHLLILHGRAVCRARRPDCPACLLADYCPSAVV